MWTHSSISAAYQAGHVFATNDFIKGANFEATKIRQFESFGIRYSKQTTGKNLWERLYNHPSWGIGIKVFQFYHPQEIGNPIALYGFFNAPILHQRNLSINYEIGFGPSFNWKSFNPVTNKFNSAIGAREAFLINAGLLVNYKLNKNLDIETGISLTHFSNGALKLPNLGINTISPKLAIKYNMPNRSEFIDNDIPKFERGSELTMSVFTALKNVVFDSINIDIIEKYEGLYFPVVGVAAVFNRRMSHKSKIGLGLSISYNGSLDAQAAVDDNELEAIESPFGDKIQLSIYPSYEVVIHRLSIVLQPAFYLYRKQTGNLTPTFHQRIGLKYHITPSLSAGLTLRDYSFHVSDFIEWSVGYTIAYDQRK